MCFFIYYINPRIVFNYLPKTGQTGCFTPDINFKAVKKACGKNYEKKNCFYTKQILKLKVFWKFMTFKERLDFVRSGNWKDELVGTVCSLNWDDKNEIHYRFNLPFHTCVYNTPPRICHKKVVPSYLPPRSNQTEVLV